METYKLKYSGEEVDETLQLTNDETKGNEALKTQLDANNTKLTTLSTNVNQLKSQVLTTDNTLKTEIQDRAKQDNILMSYINNKQDTLTAGSGITIKNNIISADGGSELAQEIWDRKQADNKLQTNINNTNSAIDAEVRNRTSDISDVKDSIRVIKNEYVAADAKLQENIDGKVSKSGDTMTGKLSVPQVETGTGDSNYFQSRKFRGEGDASTYYHAIDFGYANHNQVDFYEYGGVWNFWKNTSSTAGGTKVASLQEGKLVERNNTLTYPGKSGTLALTSDVDVKQDKLIAGNNITIDENNVISAITGKADIEGEKEAREEADNALQSQIDTLTSNLSDETTDRKNYDENLRLSILDINNKLTSETMNRESADNTLQKNIDTLKTTKQDVLTAGTNITIVDGVISAKGGGSGDVTTEELEKEINARKTADSTLQSNIDKKQDTLTAGNNITITNNVISATGGGDVTTAQLNQEISNRQKADNALQTSINTISTKLDNEINRAGTRENELEDSISDLNTRLTNEITTRQDADSTLQSNIDKKQDKLIAGSGITISNNIIRADASGYVTKSDFNTEVQIRQNTDADLQTSINSLQDKKQDVLTAGSNITIDENNVISANQTIDFDELNAKTVNSTDVNSNYITTYRILGMGHPGLNAVGIELSANQQDYDMQFYSLSDYTFWKGNTTSRVPTESTDRLFGFDNTNMYHLSNSYAFPSTSGTLALTSDVRTGVGELQTAVYAKFDEVSESINTVSSNVDTVSTNLTTEINARKTADSTLQSNIDKKQDTLTAGNNITITNNVISATGGGDVTTAQLNQEISNRQKADNALQTSINTISTKLDNEINRAGTRENELEDSISDLNTRLTNEITTRQDADSTLQSNIDKKQDKLIAGSGITISNNIIRADASGYVTKSDFNTEVQIRQNTDADLQTSINSLQDKKQDVLTAGSNITIDENNVISANQTIDFDELNAKTVNSTDVNSNYITTYRILGMGHPGLNAVGIELSANQQDYDMQFYSLSDYTFWKGNTTSRVPTESTDRLFGFDNTNMYHLSNSYAFPSTSGTLALTSDVRTGVGELQTAVYAKFDEVSESINTVSSNVDTVSTNLTTEINARKTADSTLQTNIDKKQDKLTAGAGISITNNTISTSFSPGRTVQFINNCSYAIGIAILQYDTTGTLTTLAWYYDEIPANTTVKMKNTLAWGYVRQGLIWPTEDVKITLKKGLNLSMMIPGIDTSGDWNDHTAGGLFYNYVSYNGLNYPLSTNYIQFDEPS